MGSGSGMLSVAFRWRVLAFLFGTTIPFVACGEVPPPEWHQEGGHRWRPLRVDGSREAGFRRLPASRTDIAFRNTVSPEATAENRNLAHGSGVALGDVDGDGRVDVYLARLEGPNALYRNLGEWRFEEVARERGVAAAERSSTGAVLADTDGDGDLDLFVTALGGPNSLYVNDGSGHFVEGTAKAGLQSERGSMTPTLADVDGDGDLDLFVANYKVRSALDLFPRHERTFEAITRRVEGELRVVPRMREHYRLVELPGHGDTVSMQRAEPDFFYLNDGVGGFERLSWTSGRFLDREGEPLDSVPDWFGFTARFYDVDSDGDQDLYVCNDFQDPDQFWINRGDGTFRAVSFAALRTTSNGSMSVDFADIDRDGDVDFFLADMLSRHPVRRRVQRAAHTAFPKIPGRIRNRPQKQRNTLFLNRSDGTFAQIAEYAGVRASEWSWGVMFLDVDLDGYEDLLINTGHVWDVLNLDTQMKFLRTGRRLDWETRARLHHRLKLRNVAFRNRGDWTFEEVGGEWGWAGEEDVSHGLASADLDGDGDQDVVVNRLGSKALVLRNEASEPRVKVRLVGEPPNTRGIGAEVRVLGGPVPSQSRQMTAGGLYLSSSAPELTFAAGRAGQAGEPADSLRIEVRWPNGKRSVVRRAEANRVYEIRESAAAGATDAGSGGESAGADSSGPLFEDVSERLGHEHVDRLYEDRKRQPLLPSRLSQLGPGVSWLDVEGDGREDLLISSGRGGRLAYYRNVGGGLRRVDLGLGEVAHDQTTILGLPADGRGEEVLLVGQSSYESPAARASQVASVLEVSPGPGGWREARAERVVEGSRASTGPLALADLEGDGDLDLFVGGRVMPGAYPRSAASRLYRNEGGRWVDDEVNAAVLSEVGLVSAAVFSDVDGDGDPDLLLALEWGPVRLLVNEDGQLRDRTRAWGLAEYTSRWNGLSTGDLNGDGRMDVLATSWGRNTRYQRVGEERPVFVYHGDFDRDGTVDVLEAQPGTREGRDGVFPMEHTLPLSQAFPRVARRFGSLRALATATVEEVIGRPLEEVERREIVTLDHSLFLNRGGGFEVKSLPAEAQLAPAFYAGVADFDGDGREDVFLSQNFYPTAVETPRYDAGRGLLLRGDGRGGLEPLPARRSGIEVYGDQRGAAFSDFDADGRVDLAVSQNGASTKLYRNVGARPGLRVRLEGPPGNPRGVGAQMRVHYEDGGRGPIREVHAGSGYWSQDGTTQVLGVASTPRALWVRWPGGGVTRMPLARSASEVTVRAEGG